MKIEYDGGGLEKIDEFLYIYTRDVFRRNNLYYKFVSACSVCGQSFFMRINYPTDVCSVSCSNKSTAVRAKISTALTGLKKTALQCSAISKRMSKGGVVEKNIPLFDTYAKQLIPVEEVKNNNGLLEVRCAYCGKWFIPKRTSVEGRAQFIKGNTDRECRLYCSDVCKDNCPIFNKRNGCKSNKSIYFTTTQLNTWSKEVLKRADYKCEYCGEKAEHAHHVRPKKLEPGLALDPDNGVACCVKCHYKYGHSGECSSFNISKLTTC